MTVFSLPARRSARIRPYLRELERRRVADAHAFLRFVGQVILAGLGVGR